MKAESGINEIYKYTNRIVPINKQAKNQAVEIWNHIAKPLNGMGKLEEYIAQIYAIIGPIKKLKKCVAVMCADNGIVARGVTQTDSSVTSIVAKNMVYGKSTVTNMARIIKADVYPYDVGMIQNVKDVETKKVMNGTNDFFIKPAMTKQQVTETIRTGIEIACDLKSKGYHLIASGEMGIGNTTTSSAIIAVLFGVDASLVTGKGAGLSQNQMKHKAEVINQAICKHNPNKDNVIDILSKVGGLDIAALTGLFLGGAYAKIPVIIDGLISSVAALIATKIKKEAVEYMIPSHMSFEPAAKMVMNALQLEPILHCNMALGEGTGAVAIMPMLDMALEVFNCMPTFQETQIKEYQPL